jgi:hypothetical protein
MPKSLAFLFTLILSCLPDSLPSYELVVACMFRDEAPYLKEWIEYHKMVGVDHFWLYNDKSQDNWEEVLSPYIQEGLVEVFDWFTPTKQQYISYQCKAFKDAIQKGKGTTSWLAFIDTDEFILPMKDSTLPKCLNTHFKKADAVFANWRCFGSGPKYIPKGDPLLFELTYCSKITHSHNNIGKSIVRPDAVDDSYVWNPHHTPLLPGKNYVNGDGDFLNFRGSDLELDGSTHPKYIRINHYIMRDRGYFENVRLARARYGYEGHSHYTEELLLKHNEAFSLEKNRTLINFIKKNHPKLAKEFWAQKK